MPNDELVPLRERIARQVERAEIGRQVARSLGAPKTSSEPPITERVDRVSGYAPGPKIPWRGTDQRACPEYSDSPEARRASTLRGCQRDRNTQEYERQQPIQLRAARDPRECASEPQPRSAT